MRVLEGPIGYAQPEKRDALEADLDRGGRARPPREIAAHLVTEQREAVDQMAAETNASTDRLRLVAELRQPKPALIANPTPQQEIADIMLKMTYGEFMDMKAGMEASGMQIDERKLYDWAKASAFKTA